MPFCSETSLDGNVGVAVQEVGSPTCANSARLMIDPQDGGTYTWPVSGNNFPGGDTECTVTFPNEAIYAVYDLSGGNSDEASNFCSFLESESGAQP
jgi:hypothetical protein